MSTWVAFLRAINLGATRKFPKGDIAAATEAAGFGGVATHINTGNVRLETRMRSRARIEAALERAYLESTGFEVPAMAFRADELVAVVEDADRLAHDGPHLVSLLKAEPDADAVAALAARAGPHERLHVAGRAAHLLFEGTLTDTKLATVVERHLGVATNRNLTVVRAVAAKWCS